MDPFLNSLSGTDVFCLCTKNFSAHAVSFTQNTYIELCLVFFLLLHDIYHFLISLVKCQQKEKKKSRNICIE